MSATYQAVGWNRFKKRYDIVAILGVVLFLAAFVATGLIAFPEITAEILLIRASACAAFALLHVVLAIGPLCRLDPRWLPLLYNRRHLGVLTFLVSLLHAALVTLTYHAGADVNPIVSILATDSGGIGARFPFQALGFGALLILFAMAATSHDFWLTQLTAPVWKTLHMAVYAAYFLLVGHVALGVLQSETSPFILAITVLGVLTVAGLHTVAGWRTRAIDRPAAEPTPDTDGFVPVCRTSDLVDGVPFPARVAGERVAVLLYDHDHVSCVSGVCQHQNGPLAEGRYRDGCLVCPWHGYQYRPADGRSPEPFTERVPTFEVRIRDGRVWISGKPRPAGTHVAPARLPQQPATS